MSIRELKRHLKKQGCIHIRAGSSHEIWESSAGKKFTVPYGKFHPRLIHKINKQIRAE